MKYKCPYLYNVSEGKTVQNFGATVVAPTQTHWHLLSSECISKHINDLGINKILAMCPNGASYPMGILGFSNRVKETKAWSWPLISI